MFIKKIICSSQNFKICHIPVFDRVLTLKVSQTAITAACETFSDFTIARYTIMNLKFKRILFCIRGSVFFRL